MIDWEAVQTEVKDYLQSLLRIDTTNPPGNETRAAEYLSEVLVWEDYEPLITESEPGRGNVTARLQGGPEPPLLLLGHTDVVASEPDKWTYPPFSGAVSDGCIWGRGALDMKNMVAAELMVMVLLKREGIKLNRDVIFAATADEEAGKGEHGPGWLLDNHPEQIAAPFIITEGGGADLHMGDAHFFTCQTGQKGICRMRIRAKGTPGHGSIPHTDNAVVKLCQAMGALDGVQLPMHPGATVQAFIEGIAATQDESTAAMLRDVLVPEKSAAALQDLSLDADLKAQLGAVMRNTASVTMLDAGSKINVIPTEATAWIDGRLAPGQTQESFIAELRPYIGDEVEVEVDQYSPPLEASADTELYRTIVGVMGQQAPEATVIPTISNGGTDAKHIVPRRPDTQVYGFMPYRQTPGLEEMKLIHGHDERTSLENLLFATRVLYDIVCRFGGLT
jgi:acetylornithine deacetylase/succinyl-diaminopimelate desuccinylase-like protein